MSGNSPHEQVLDLGRPKDEVVGRSSAPVPPGLALNLPALSGLGGNQAMNRLIAQRVPDTATEPSTAAGFEPEIQRSPVKSVTVLGAEVTEDVEVTNARSAPRGTKFSWSWGQPPPAHLAPGPPPPDGARATLRATATEIGNVDATAWLTATTGDHTTFERAPAMEVAIRRPQVFWEEKVQPGGLATGAPRDPGTLYIGDTLLLTATFPAGTKARSLGLYPRLTAAPALKTQSEPASENPFKGLQTEQGSEVDWSSLSGLKTDLKWKSETEVTLEVTPKTPGPRALSLEFSGSGMEDLPAREVNFRGVLDEEHFKKRCGTAHVYLTEQYLKATEWFEKCYLSYEAAYNTHAGILKDVAASRALGDGLLFSVLFGVIGGAAADLAGRVIAKVFQVTDPTNVTDVVMVGALTSTLNDLTRTGLSGIAERVLPKDATSSKLEPIAVKPLTWKSDLVAQISKEAGVTVGILRGLNEHVDVAATEREATIYEVDPVAVVTESCKVGGYAPGSLQGSIPVPSAEEYEARFWQAWLSMFAYEQDPRSSTSGNLDVPKEVLERLASVIETLQKKGVKVPGTVVEWIKIYGESSKTRADTARHEYMGIMSNERRAELVREAQSRGQAHSK